MRDFMEFCLQVLSEFVSMLFGFSLGGYSYGNFVVVCVLVSVLIGALVIKFVPGRSDFVSRPPRVTRSSASGSRSNARGRG